MKSLILLLCLACAAPALAAKPGQKHEKNDKVIFSDHDRREILDYYKGDKRGLPPGLAKRGSLPPGLEKQLQRNGQLPPGLQKRVTAFPPDLERRLPRLPPIYRRGIIGNRAIIYDTRTRAILDIIDIILGDRR